MTNGRATRANRTIKAAAGLATVLAAGPALVGASQAAEALVTHGEQRFEFTVVHCLQNLTPAGSDVVIELQLDAVPVATPAETIARMAGAGAEVSSELLSAVVAHGPLLSVTRLADGGDMIGVTNLSDVSWITDGAMTDSAARFLQVEETGEGLRVSGESTAGGEPVTLRAECP